MIDTPVVWNVRGMGTSKCRLRKLVRKHNIAILAVAEPFHSERHVQSFAKKIKLAGCITNEKEGGKIWVFWREDLQMEWIGASSQTIHGIVTKGVHSVVLTFVYAKCSALKKRSLWTELEGLCVVGLPWLVSGDFNTIWNDAERMRGRPRPLGAMEDFNNYIDKCGLVEVPCKGRKLSWRNGQEGLARSGHV
ncbi:unnamed protein product [Fraxinus pennsylvanica]|uniref:Endonuclease/exonuclease/phosphatase domain-containing protein n=1 Tax=Fraxinus pennsylvanica TaxID=56036 RepID=A0AAD2E360_9LAMI|nr:unnamed protein product [Fraxinus pennsylvanica]